MDTVKASLKEILPDPLVAGYRKGSGFYFHQKRLISNKLSQLQYFGNTVTCPFCEKTFSRFTEFLSTGTVFAENLGFH